jgi:two-component system response regulator BaeR
MSAAPHVLVVEDEAKIAALVADYLRADGLRVTVFGRGDTAAEWLARETPDLIVLDLMLPGLDGIALCRQVRLASTVPVIMLTARVDEVDRVLGLEVGADDYVVKPFSPRELVARVRAHLRRTQWAVAPVGASRAGVALAIDGERHAASWQGRRIDLTPVEFRLLAALAERPGRVLSRQRLQDAAYVDHRVVSERTVDSHIKNLRRKLVEAGMPGDPLKAIYGVGYRYDPDADPE